MKPLTHFLTLLGLLLAGFLSLASAQRLDDTWSVSVYGHTAQVNPDGSFQIPNVTLLDEFGESQQQRFDGLSDDFLRLSGYSIAGGVPRYVISSPFQLSNRTGGVTLRSSDFLFSTAPPDLPEFIRVLPGKRTLTSLGETTQVQVLAYKPDGTAAFTDNPSTDVTQRTAFTTYRSTNPRIATVSKDGLVTARATGSVYVVALHESISASARIEVVIPVTTVIVGRLVTVTNQAIAGASVELVGLGLTNAITSSNGSFRFDNVVIPENQTQVTVRFTEPGGRVTESVLSLRPNGISDVGLVRGGGATTFTTTVAGLVTDQGGRPLQGATITIQGQTLTASTAADGTFRLSGLTFPAGTERLTVTASLSGRTPRTVTPVAIPGGVTEAGTLQLFPSASSSGNDFVLVFQENEGTPTLSLVISSDEAATGQVTIPGLSFTSPFSVLPGEATSVAIPNSAEVTTTDGVINRGIRVSSDKPVRVYGLNRAASTTDAYTALPVAALGTRYRIMAHSGGLSGSQVGVVAAEDNTVIRVRPQTAVRSRAAGVEYTVTLQALEVYQLQSSSSSQDVTGTLISSDKPVAVFGGHKCAFVPASVRACDHLVEQMIPTSAWGREFTTLPLETRANGDTFRILADQDGTTVTIDNGTSTTPVTLAAGEFHERILDGVHRITSDKPILVAQFANGQEFDNRTGDPFMMLIPAAEQFLRSYTFSTVPVGSLHYVNVIAPATDADAGLIVLDGAPINASSFTAIPNSPFKCAKLSISQGVHTMSAPNPFGIYVYGFGNFDSYGYPGGLGISNSIQNP